MMLCDQEGKSRHFNSMIRVVVRLTAWPASLIILATLIAGCARTMIAQRVTTDYNPENVIAELDFWHSLPGRSAVSNDEALFGLILLEGVPPESVPDYASRVAHAKASGWISEDWNEDPALAVQRGVVAAAVARICRVEGGLMMRLTNGSGRYSLKELIYIGVMTPGSENQVLSGLDYLGVITKAQDYMTARGIDVTGHQSIETVHASVTATKDVHSAEDDHPPEHGLVNEQHIPEDEDPEHSGAAPEQDPVEPPPAPDSAPDNK
jgi:hypothetical protein